MQTSTTAATAILITNPTTRAMSVAREEWRRANEAGEGFAGDDAVDEIVSTLLGHGSDRVLLVVQAGRTLACAYSYGASYGASWCVDVTQALLDA